MAISECEHDKLFVLVDETTAKKCWPLIKDFLCLREANLITIKADDTNKTLESVSHVWSELQRMRATRHSCMINLGGGMVTDLGGFAASTFKRGIDFINIPTTLLAMVDASVGGKTGINFGGLKNEIGVFNDSKFVILDTHFLQTLDRENILSGYAEMLKHGLISNEKMWAELIGFMDESLWFMDDSQDKKQQATINHKLSTLNQLLADSVKVKEGHAFESFAMKKGEPILHGYAIAYGIIAELYLSAVKCGFPQDKLRQTVNFIREHYGQMTITCDDYPCLLELMTHDKKNTSGQINFTLLGSIGDIRINQTATEEDIKEALDFYREG